MIIVPPGGFAGMGQQTQAAQLTVQRALRSGGGSRRNAQVARQGKRRRTMATQIANARRRRSGSGPRTTRATTRGRRVMKARMVKGSAAAKRYMAKIRKMRKR